MAFDVDSLPEPARLPLLQARHILACYTRHFVGRPRQVADDLLLDELTTRLAAVRDQLSGIEGAATVAAAIGDRVDLLQTALRQVRDDDTNREPRDWSTILAERVNGQFALYRTHIAGRPRASRRPALIRRIVTALERIVDDMSDPRFEALEDHQHASNLAYARTELDRVRDEAAAIADEHARTSVDERIRALGVAANGEIADYRTHLAQVELANLDPARLAGICDRLGELELQMAELDRDHDDSVNRANRRLVARTLDRYEVRLRTWRLASLINSRDLLRDAIDAADATDDDKRAALGHLDALLAHPIVQRIVSAPGEA